MVNPEFHRITCDLGPIRDAAVFLAFIPPIWASAVNPAVFSGFCIESEGCVFWITAAHVFDEIDKAFEMFPSGQLYLRGLKSRSVATPFREDQTSRIRLDRLFRQKLAEGRLNLSGDPIDPQDILEMDMGVIELSKYYVESLTWDGMRPLTSEDLGPPPEDEVRSYMDSDRQMNLVVLGGLAQSVERTTASGEFNLDWKALPVMPLDWSKPRLSFKPLWTAEQHPGSVVGMSGGPIVLLGFGRARVIAVQSGELIAGQRPPSQLFGWDIQHLQQLLTAPYVSGEEAL